MIALYILLWWLSGFLPMVWLEYRGGLETTWAELLLLAVMGIIGGPVLLVLVAAYVISLAEFWHKPVFKRRARN